MFIKFFNRENIAEDSGDFFQIISMMFGVASFMLKVFKIITDSSLSFKGSNEIDEQMYIQYIYIKKISLNNFLLNFSSGNYIIAGI